MTRHQPGGWHRVDYVKITVLGFAISALWACFHTVVLPIRLLDFIAETQKNTALGVLTFTGLALAMLVQPIAGTVSDRSGFKWGRRRPYILVASLLAVVFILGAGFAGSYGTIFIIYCLLQLSTNTAQGPYQAFIPDLVPPGKRGRASGVKTLLEVGGGVALLYPVSLLMDRYHLAGQFQWLWLALVILAGLVLAMMLITVITVKETATGASRQLPIVATVVKSFKIDLRTNRYFIRFLASRLLVIMAFTTLQTFALYFLQDIIGVTQPAQAAAQFSIVAAVCMLALVYPAGRLSDRMGRRPIVIAAGLVGGLGVASLFFATSLLHVMLSGGLIGIAFGAFMSSSWALATDLVAKDEEAKYLGLTNITTAGGSALARLMGPVIDFFNASQAGLGYQVMLGACLLYLVAGTLLLWKRRPVAISHPRN